MSKQTVILYKPDGKTYTFDNVKSAYLNDNGTFYVQPSVEDQRLWGKLVQTNLPFILSEAE